MGPISIDQFQFLISTLPLNSPGVLLKGPKLVLKYKTCSKLCKLKMTTSFFAIKWKVMVVTKRLRSSPNWQFHFVPLSQPFPHFLPQKKKRNLSNQTVCNFFKLNLVNKCKIEKISKWKRREWSQWNLCRTLTLVALVVPYLSHPSCPSLLN